MPAGRIIFHTITKKIYVAVKYLGFSNLSVTCKKFDFISFIELYIGYIFTKLIVWHITLMIFMLKRAAELSALYWHCILILHYVRMMPVTTHQTPNFSFSDAMLLKCLTYTIMYVHVDEYIGSKVLTPWSILRFVMYIQTQCLMSLQKNKCVFRKYFFRNDTALR